MKLNTILIFCLFLSFNAFCQKPKSIDEAVTMLLEKLDDESKTLFKDKEERDAVSDLHMSVGMGIRNGWIRHGEAALKDEFNKLGVGDPDTMSSIILTAAHRKLNGVPIDIEEQVEAYVEDSKAYHEEDLKVRSLAEALFDKYSIGDEIRIYYPTIIKAGLRKAVNYHLSEWKLTPGEDLIITGKITKKYYLSNSNPFFELLITNMNFPGIYVTGVKTRIGEEHMFNLKWLKIEPAK